MKKMGLCIRYPFYKLTISEYIGHSNGIFSIKSNKLSAKQILLALTLIISTVSITSGTISTAVFLRDSNTPIELVDPNIPHIYQDIMVGAKLKVIISSDTNEIWSDGLGGDGGGLAIEEAYWPYGILSAREPLVEGDWSGSHLSAAGTSATVYDWEEEGIDGFDLYTGSHDIEAEDWFVIDYNAVEIGDCNVGFYDHRINWDVPIYYLCFSQVRTRDFNSDTVVNLRDYAIFTSHLLETNCNAPDWCGGTDLNTDQNVNIYDLMLFCEFWLEKTK